jgi:hypothetical protein
MTPAFERPKTVHALGRAATVIGNFNHIFNINGINLYDLRCSDLFLVEYVCIYVLSENFPVPTYWTHSQSI